MHIATITLQVRVGDDYVEFPALNERVELRFTIGDEKFDTLGGVITSLSISDPKLHTNLSNTRED